MTHGFILPSILDPDISMTLAGVSSSSPSTKTSSPTDTLSANLIHQ